MSIEIHVLCVIPLNQQSSGRIDLRSRSILQPAAILSVIWIGGIHCISRIKEHLVIEDIVVLERRSKHAEVAREPVAEGFLCNINLCHQVAIPLASDDGIVVYIAKRSPIVAVLSTAAESQIMVLHLSGTGNRLTKIGIVAFIVILES